MLVALLALLAGAADLSTCAAEVAGHPELRDGYRCYYLAARGGAPWDEVEARLAGLEADPAHGAWALLTRANMHSDHGEDDTEALYLAAIERFAARDLPAGGAYARVGLATWLAYGEAWGRVFPLLDEAEALAAEASDPWAGPMVRATRARYLYRSGRPEAAIATLEELEPVVFPDGPYQLRLVTLYVLAGATADTARWGEAWRWGERLVELVTEAGDLHVAAVALGNQVTVLLNSPKVREQVGEEALLELVERSLQAARDGHNPYSEAAALVQLGQVRGRAGRADLAAGVALLEELGELPWTADQLAMLALIDLDADPAGALAELARADALARTVEDNAEVAQLTHFYLAWGLLRAGETDRGVAELAATLDEVEAWRDRQGSEAGVRVQGFFAGLYYLLASAQVRQGDLAGAVHTLERLRAQSLRDALLREHVELPPAAAAARDRHQAALDRVTAAQVALMDGSGDALALQEAEAEAVLAGEAMAAALAEVRGWRHVAPRSLSEIQAVLGPDEALVYVQLSHAESSVAWLEPEARTPAWAVVVTCEGVSAVDLGDSDRIRRAAGAYLDLVRGRAGDEGLPAEVLQRELLGPILAAVPADTARLVVVPDEVLHEVPAGALLPDGAGLAVSVVPSGTVWHALRTGPTPGGQAVLALADPAPLLAGEGHADPGAAWSERLSRRLDPLPRARAEGRSAVRAGGPGSVLWVGAAASEAALRARDLRDVSVLHLAAHALIDGEAPERSAIVLAPGGSEDGLLQAREVASLDMDGRVVVLSACSSATGETLSGVGVLGLSRALFRAGSRAVVATLWSVRDDEAEALLARLYAHLGRGEALGDALVAAQAELRGDGAPAEAWAGFVVLGDGAVRPLPPRRRLGPWGLLAMVAVGGLAVVGWGLRVRS